MELRQLSHFVAVAKHRSFTQAARDVHIVQSSLSASVRQLERELGALLFDRTTRRVELTPAGSALLPVAQRMLADARAAREEIAAVTGLLHGQVGVGTIQALTWVDLPAALARFRQTYPGVEISLTEAPVDEMIDALRAGELDLAYIARDQSRLPHGVQVVAIRQEELVVVTAADHPLAGRPEVRLTELESELFVAFQAGPGLQTVIERLCVDAGLERRIALRVTQVDLLIELVSHGLGIAILPAPVAERTGLAQVRIVAPRPRRTVALVTRAGSVGNPAARALLDELHGPAAG